MKRKRVDSLKEKKSTLPAVVILAGVFLLFLELLEWDSFVVSGVHFLTDSVSLGSENAGESVYQYLSVLTDIPSAQNRINELELQVSKYESDIAYVSKLEKENESLKTQIDLSNPEHRYIEAEVLGRVQESTLRLNAGESEGVKVGDTVMLGYSFVGIVMDTTEERSTVRLPFNEKSSLEVWVSSTAGEEDVLSRAVVTGSEEGNILIENISKKAGVKEGDYVLVNDERVVDTLVLGKIAELDDDPASTSYSGVVEPIVDYDSLIDIFICIEW